MRGNDAMTMVAPPHGSALLIEFSVIPGQSQCGATLSRYFYEQAFVGTRLALDSSKAETVVLKGCITNAGCTYIAAGLKDSSIVTDLDLANNQSGNGADSQTFRESDQKCLRCT